MKQLINIAVLCLTVCFLFACGEKIITMKGADITVKGADGSEYESYQECCAAQDFQAAHQFLAKMKNAISKKDDESKYDAERELESATEEVFKHEALFLMSQGDDAAKKRIVYLLKEEGYNREHIDMLIDLAIENDDEAFVKTLANQYNKEVDKERMEKIAEYLSSKSNVESKEYLKQLFKRLDMTDLLIDLAIRDNDIEFINEYLLPQLSLSQTSLLLYLAEKKEKKYSEMILGLLSEYENEIPVRPALEKGISYVTFEYETKPLCDAYIRRVKDYNDNCRSILNIATKAKNQYLAQRTVSKTKQSIEYYENQYHSFNIDLSDEDIKSINASYNEAVRSGAFK